MSFHDVEFPRHISYGSLGGPGFNTTVLPLNSGFEKRNINWEEAKAAYEAAHGIKSREQMEELLAFFYARRGRAYTFRYFDWMDYKTGFQTLGVGDGAQTAFQITKTYVSDGFTYVRDITKPIDGTVENIRVDGVVVAATVNYTTGVITLALSPDPGAVVTIDECEFNVHARFDIDKMDVVQDFWETMSWPSIPIVEVREE